MDKITDVVLGDTKKIGDLQYNSKTASSYKVTSWNGLYYIVAEGNIDYRTLVIDRNVFLSAITLGDTLASLGCFRFFTKKIVGSDILSETNLPKEMQHDLEPIFKQYYDNINALVLDWCMKYGFPFLEDGTLGLLDDDAFHLDTGEYGLQVDSFILALIRFHTIFYRWRFTEFDEKPLWFTENKRSEEAIGRSLSSAFNGDISYQLDFDDKTKHFKFSWVSDNLFYLLSLQLALLATRQDPDGKHIRRCPKCNDWFEADHGAQIYCGKRRGCNAKAVAQANWRKRNNDNRRMP